MPQHDSILNEERVKVFFHMEDTSILDTACSLNQSGYEEERGNSEKGDVDKESKGNQVDKKA
jgi:hypothetical protein